MTSKNMTPSSHQNTKNKVRMACHQILSTYNFIKTQKLRYG